MTTSFSADTTAIASEVNQNFTDVLTALNSFDATNLTGTIALARISNLTSSQMAAAFFKDEDDMASDSATAVSSQQALKAYVDAQIAAYIASEVTLSVYTTNDSDNNTMLKSHAYKAATDGWASSYDVGLDATDVLYIYVGTTNDPEGAGALIQTAESSSADIAHCVSALVAEDEYFEVLSPGSTPIIRWKSFGTLSKPVDQD